MSWLQTNEVTVPLYEVRAGKPVFAVQLRERALRQEDLARNWSSITSTSSQFLLDLEDENDCNAGNNALGELGVRVVTMRSYSQFRKLWKDLIRSTRMPPKTSLTRANSSQPSGTSQPRRRLSRSLSNSFRSLPMSGLGRESSSCCRCRNWNCTFRGFHHFLKSYPFPSKFVIKRSTPAALENRRQGLELFISTGRGLFDTFPRPFLESVDVLETCKVLAILDDFFGFSKRNRSNSWARTTLRLPSVQKPNSYVFTSSRSFGSESTGRTPPSSYSGRMIDIDIEMSAEYSRQRGDGNFDGLVMNAESFSRTAPCTVLHRGQEIEKTHSPSRRSRYYRGINIRWQTTFLSSSAITTTSNQADSNEATPIQAFLEDCKDHGLLDYQALGNSLQESWDAARQWELALYVASQIDHVRAVESILYRGTNPSAVMKDGSASLHAACRGGHRSIVAMLLTHGADTNAMDANGVSPLLTAVQLGNVEIVEMLVENGANVNLCSANNVSALHVAVACQMELMVQLLLEYGAFVNIPNAFNGKTPLHLAAQCGSLSMSNMLLQHGGDIRLQTARGLDIIALAKAHGHQSVANLCRNFNRKQTSERQIEATHSPATVDCPSIFYGSLDDALSDEVTIVSEDGQAYAVL